MGNFISTIDKFASNFTKGVIKYRWVVILLTILISFGIGSYGKNLTFATNYRIFFSGLNPDLIAFENLQKTYTKNDNILFVIQPKEGTVFKPNVLKAVEELTEQGWQIPYAIRVDSIANFQHSHANGDELIV